MTLSTMASFALTSEIDVGAHYYFNLTSRARFHLETFTESLLVCLLLLLFFIFYKKGIKFVPEKLQNFGEILFELLDSITKTQISLSKSSNFFPYIATLFLFILMSNWIGALLPWKYLKLAEGELGAPTNDINTTTCLAILTSITYFYAGIKTKGINYFKKYIKPSILLLPINVIEDFTKPLSLNFRLFGNIVADELTTNVLASLVPLFVPFPIMILGLFASSIQALIFATLAAAYIGEAIE